MHPACGSAWHTVTIGRQGRIEACTIFLTWIRDQPVSGYGDDDGDDDDEVVS